MCLWADFNGWHRLCVIHSEKWSSCLKMNFLLGKNSCSEKAFLLQGNETMFRQEPRPHEPGCESSCTKRIICLHARILCVSNGGMIFWALGPRNNIFQISLNWLKNALKHVFWYLMTFKLMYKLKKITKGFFTIKYNLYYLFIYLILNNYLLYRRNSSWCNITARSGYSFSYRRKSSRRYF